MEKPLCVHKGDCERLLATPRAPEQVFAIMFNQRTDPYYRKMRDLLGRGELGTIRRIHWTITDWFRTETYYRSSDWRATWAGEGGGVLINQCVHNIDLFQWMFGMPVKVRSLCQFGRYHDIEVEDAVSAIFELEGGATATFVTSTGEAPGSNRLEVVGEKGTLVLEGNHFRFLRNECPMSEFSRTSPELYARPPHWTAEIPLSPDRGEQHLGIVKNFVRAILNGEELIAPASEGIHSVELLNAILMSSIKDKTVKLPLSSAGYERLLKELITRSKPKTGDATKTSRVGVAHDFGAASRSC
jgi:predicted dehydrogenase